MEGKWANLPPELCVIKDRWLGAYCEDNMAPTERQTANSPLKPFGRQGPLGETDQPMEALCLLPPGGYDGFETVSRTSMSPDSLECISRDGDHRSIDTFPLNGGHVADDDDRRGRQGLNVDSCTQRAMTEKGRDSDFCCGGKCCDSEAGFSVVEPAPICGGGVLGRPKNERLQEDFRPKVSSSSSPRQSSERGVTSTEERQGDISVTTPALALVKPGLRSDAEIVHADLSTSSRHGTVPLKVSSHSKAASDGPIGETLSPPAPATDYPPKGRRGNGSHRTQEVNGSGSKTVSSRLRPPGWARTMIQATMIEQDGKKGSSPSGETATSRQITEVLDAITIENRSDASCDTRNTVIATPALSSCRQDTSTQPVVMVVDYSHRGSSRHKTPPKSRRRGGGSANNQNSWDLPSPLEDHRCHLAIAVDGRSRPTRSSYSSRTNERRYGGEASCESSSYLEAMGRRERRSARFEAERRRAEMARAARKLKPSGTIVDRTPWGKGGMTPAEAERRKLLQRKADYACEQRKKAQEQAQAARHYLSKEKEIFDSSNVVPFKGPFKGPRLSKEGSLSNDDTVTVGAVKTGLFAGRARVVVPLPCEISPGSSVPCQISKRLPRVSMVGKKAECGTGHGPKQRQRLVEASGEEEQLIASIAHLDGLLNNGVCDNSLTPRADRIDKRPGGEGGKRRILPDNHNRVRVTSKPPYSRNVGNTGAVGKARTRKGSGEERGLSTLATNPNQGDGYNFIPVEASAADGHEPVVSASNDGMAQSPVEFPPLFPRDGWRGDFVCRHRRCRPQHTTEGIELLHPLKRTPPPGQPSSDCCKDCCHGQAHETLQRGMRCLPPLDKRHHECNSHRPLVLNTYQTRGVVESYQNDDRSCVCSPR